MRSDVTASQSVLSSSTVMNKRLSVAAEGSEGLPHSNLASLLGEIAHAADSLVSATYGTRVICFSFKTKDVNI